MVYRTLADLTLALHLSFILFVALGAFLSLLWPRVVWLHLPAAVWGVLISFFGWPCPLTPLENHLRRLGGESGYTESFVERYLVSIIYPGELTRTGFVALGLGVLALNVAVYAWIHHRRRRAHSTP